LYSERLIVTGSAEQFISKVKTNNHSELRNRTKGVTVPWQASLLKGLGWFTAVVGFAITLGFFILVESVHSQLGGLANADLAATLEASPEINELMKSVGIDWFPDFMKIYSIRFVIVASVGALFACIAFAFFAFARSKRKN
jgi:uncharacterized RDD family membrane protein YckC